MENMKFISVCVVDARTWETLLTAEGCSSHCALLEIKWNSLEWLGYEWMREFLRFVRIRILAPIMDHAIIFRYKWKTNKYDTNAEWKRLSRLETRRILHKRASRCPTYTSALTGLVWCSCRCEHWALASTERWRALSVGEHKLRWCHLRRVCRLQYLNEAQDIDI